MTLTDPHPTLVKFGYPDTLIHQGTHWALLVRPAQPTLGSLVLCALADVRAYGEMPAAAFVEQGELVGPIERMLAQVSAPERINYLMLMMVDPQVHFHIIPRYAGERSFGDVSFPDSGWPGLPDLRALNVHDQALITTLKNHWKL